MKYCYAFSIVLSFVQPLMKFDQFYPLSESFIFNDIHMVRLYVMIYFAHLWRHSVIAQFGMHTSLITFERSNAQI